jgi:hypothetical protein
MHIRVRMRVICFSEKKTEKEKISWIVELWFRDVLT